MLLVLLTMEKELGLIHGLSRSVINPSQDKFPVSGKDDPAQGNDFSDLPVVFVDQLSSGDTGLSLPQEGGLLVFGDTDFGVEFEK